MAVKQKNVDMTNAPAFSGIVKFVVPILLIGIIQHLYTAVDSIILGQFSGSDVLAGVGTTGPLINTIINLFLGLSVGVQVVLGRALGAGDDAAVHKTVHTAMLISIIAGLIISFIGIFFADYLLIMMDVPSDVMPYAKIYLQINFAGKIPAMVYNFGVGILRAKGDTKRPLYLGMVTGLIKVVLSFVFVAYFNMNSAGVSIATLISTIINAVVMLYFLTTEDDSGKLYFTKLKIYKKQLIDIAVVGIPSGIQNTVASLSNVITQSAVNSFGSAAIMAGNSAASNIQSFYATIKGSFRQATVSFVSRNMGAKKYDRINKIVKCCFSFMAVFWVIEIFLSVFGGEFLIGLYVPGDIEAIKTGALRLAIIGVSYGIFGLSEILSGALRGMGYSFQTMVISLATNCGIRILWILTVFKKIGTLESLYISFPISWAVALIANSVLFVYAKRKLNREQMEQCDGHGQLII